MAGPAAPSPPSARQPIPRPFQDFKAANVPTSALLSLTRVRAIANKRPGAWFNEASNFKMATEEALAAKMEVRCPGSTLNSTPQYLVAVGASIRRDHSSTHHRHTTNMPASGARQPDKRGVVGQVLASQRHVGRRPWSAGSAEPTEPARLVEVERGEGGRGVDRR